jgi:hypothetical protein
MIRKIINTNFSFKANLKKSVIYCNLKNGIYKSWSNRFKNIDSNKLTPIDNDKEVLYKKKWSIFHRNVNLETLWLCTNLSGEFSYNYVPEEIFSLDIEKTLNSDPNVDFISNKSFYNHWFGKGIFPKDVFHKIDGKYYNENLEPINLEKVKDLTIKFPVVLKPNRDTFGGADINFIKNRASLLKLITIKKNFVVQEKLKQHSFFSKFNDKGINTMRVCTYRSIVDNEIKFLNASLRFGVGGSLDNETAGGVVCYIKDQGELCGLAKNKYAINYTKHPDSHESFRGKVPYYEEMIKLAKIVSEKIFYARLISLDMCLDSDENWRVVEINLNGQTIRFSQYAGQPFFGKYTDEIIDYCIQNHWSLKK